MRNERLRDAFMQAQKTIEDVAQAIDVDPKTVQRWLQGRIPHARHRWAVAQFLHLKESDLWQTQIISQQASGEHEISSPPVSPSIDPSPRDNLQTIHIPLKAIVLHNEVDLIGKRFKLPHLLQESLVKDDTNNKKDDETFPLHVHVRASGAPTIDHENPQAAIARTQQEDVIASLTAEDIALLSMLEQGDETMAFDPSKRETLQKMATALLAVARPSVVKPFVLLNPEPWERLLRAQRKQSCSAAINTATLEHFEQLLTISWQLCDENQFDIAEGILLTFLPHLLSLPQPEPRTASLTTNSLRLESIVAHHHLRLNEKMHLCEQAVDYARQSGDANTLVFALLEQATAYKYFKQPELRMKALQEALYHSEQTSPLVQSRIYSLLAVALAERKRVSEASFYIGFAQEIFPDDPTKDPNVALADSNIFHLSHHSGIVSTYTKPFSETFQAFDYYAQHPSTIAIPERIRLEIVNGKSRVAILANDAEKYASHLEDVMIGSIHIGSKKRFDEASDIFSQEMPRSWLAIPQIKALAEHYSLNILS